MKYQVVMMGTPWNETEIIKSLHSFSGVEFVMIENLDFKEPYLCLYFGQTSGDSHVTQDDEKILASFVQQRKILPVAKTAEDFKTNFPESLKELNGFFLNPSEPGALLRLKNFIASYFGLIHANKKIFISYKRSDLSDLAQKIFTELIKRKYKPFLDSYSLEEGVDFQEYLRHELIDSDMILMLDSPSFFESSYCMEEFNIANQERIPILDIRFDIRDKSKLHSFCDFKEFDMTCTEANKDDALVNDILDLMEQTRIRAYQFKRQYVLDEFYVVCRKFGLNVVEEGGFLRCDTTQECFYPLTYIPTAQDLHKVHSIFKSIPLFSKYTKQVLYNGSYCRPNYQTHLLWLESNLPIKIFNIAQML